MTVWSFIQNKFIFYRQITGNVIYFYCPRLITSRKMIWYNEGKTHRFKVKPGALFVFSFFLSPFIYALE